MAGRRVRTKKRRYWSAADVKALRKLAGRQPAARVAWALKRSLLAVRFKAHVEGISLAMR